MTLIFIETGERLKHQPKIKEFAEEK